MQAVAGLSILVLIVASGIIGSRLLRLWRRTRQRPELYLGLMLILVTMLGYPLHILSRATEFIGFPAAWASLALGSVCVDLGFVFLYLFTWKTFRPGSRWWGLLVAAAALGFVVNVGNLTVETWAAGSTLMDMASMPWWRSTIGILATDAGYVWTGIESFRYYANLRKRQALGLADPIVTNRMLLWGQMSVVTVAVLMLNNVTSLMAIDVLTTPWIMACTSLGGVVQAIYLFLIFLPPRRYREWVERGPTSSRPAAQAGL